MSAHTIYAFFPNEPRFDLWRKGESIFCRNFLCRHHERCNFSRLGKNFFIPCELLLTSGISQIRCVCLSHFVSALLECQVQVGEIHNRHLQMLPSTFFCQLVAMTAKGKREKSNPFHLFCPRLASMMGRKFSTNLGPIQRDRMAVEWFWPSVGFPSKTLFGGLVSKCNVIIQIQAWLAQGRGSNIDMEGLLRHSLSL